MRAAPPGLLLLSPSCLHRRAITITAELEKWARAIGRGLARDYRFRRGSSDEEELEGVALLELVRAAERFDSRRVPKGGNVEGAFRGYAHPSIKGECRRMAIRLRNGGAYHTRSEKGKEPIIIMYLSEQRTPAGDLVEVIDWRSHPGEDAGCRRAG